ncbi:hypothetical protein ACHAXA_008550 [Cyclostephanos tholiformis]|uniref:MRH domain-containing protein n=1 Tax=Cyclostephanos tholiformis TaxID=382380 RepID=A0ABD3RAB3_9STRA
MYDSVFHSTFEEYDPIRFDPYSFSGAPLGGWGRATRSRLATLPIRLVVESGSVEGGYGGGLELLFGGGGSGEGRGGGGEETLDQMGEAAREEKDDGDRVAGEDVDEDSSYQLVQGDDDSPADRSSIEQKKKETPSTSIDVLHSTGPHFTIHDATGQRFVCRMYPEDELIVSSRIDSAFYPAVTVWDEDAVVAIEDHDASTKVTGDENVFDDEDVLGGVLGGSIADRFKFSLTGIGGDVGNLPEGIRASVSKMLRKLGMVEAADALVAENRRRQQQRPDIAANDDPLVDVEVNMADEAVAAAADENFDGVMMMIVDDGGIVDGLDDVGGFDGNDNEMVAAGISDIIRAAVVGAGIGASKKENSKDGDDGGGYEGENHPKESNGRDRSSSSAPPRLTVSEVFKLLESLDGVCAQLHNGGWWSYEWCHQDTVKQFHVAFTNDSPQRLEIHDVSLIGQFDGITKIIYPKGIYDGKLMEGVITTARRVHGGDEDEISFKMVDQSAGEYEILSSDFFVPSLTDREKVKLGHERGPIIVQTFPYGDYCDEVNYHRIMKVELVCCTDDEIHQLLESKKPRTARKASDDEVKEETPQAVLVTVKEEETCVYRSRVCTPVLCPMPVPDPFATETPATKEVTANTATTMASTEHTAEQRMQDPIGSVFNAIFGNDIAEHRGELRVYFPDEVTDQEFDELIRQAEEGLDFTNDPAFERVKRTLRETRDGGRIANAKKLNIKNLLIDENDGTDIVGKSPSPIPKVMNVKAGESIREILDKTLGKRPCLMKNLGWWTYELCHRELIRQYHVENIIDATTGFAKQKITSEHLMGVYRDSGNSIEDYPNEDEHLHVVNAAFRSPTDLGVGNVNKNDRQQPSMAGGNGAVYEQEYKHGAICDHEDVALSVIKGGNVLKGSVERSSTVRYMCGKQWELIDVKEDSTCHYLLDVTVPELCQHNLFRAPMTKTQVVKCLPV